MSALPSTALPTQTRKPPGVDISHRGHNLARIVDRLSPGTYHITIVKNDVHGVDWNVEIVRSELIQRVALSNKSYLAE